MSKMKVFFREKFHALMLTIIFVSLAGSLAMLGFQSAQLQKQSAQLQQQLEATNYVAKQIKEDTQIQHDAQDAKQECFFNLFVSFVNNRTEITTADINECKVSVNGKQVSAGAASSDAQNTISTPQNVPRGGSQPQKVPSHPPAKPEEQPPQPNTPNATKPITIQPPILPIELRIN